MAKTHTRGTSTRKQLLDLWKSSAQGLGISLKEFARSEEGGEAGKTWLRNKASNPKAPLHKIGRTRKRVKRGG